MKEAYDQIVVGIELPAVRIAETLCQHANGHMQIHVHSQAGSVPPGADDVINTVRFQIPQPLPGSGFRDIGIYVPQRIYCYGRRRGEERGFILFQQNGKKRVFW